MWVTVKIEKEQKEKLERFLATLLLNRGKKIPIQRLLGLMIDHAIEDEKFIQKFEGLPPLEQDPAWIFLRKPKNWGVEDLSENIDKYVYGG